jgi:hypothetical protein
MEPTYEDFKSENTGTLIFSIESNEISVVEHIAHIFSIYSIELELLDRSVYTMHLYMLGLTRIILSKLEAL